MWSTREVAEYLGVGEGLVGRLIRAGELPATRRPGRGYALRRGDVEAFAERCRLEPGMLHSLRTDWRAAERRQRQRDRQ